MNKFHGKFLFLIFLLLLPFSHPLTFPGPCPSLHSNLNATERIFLRLTFYVEVEKEGNSYNHLFHHLHDNLDYLEVTLVPQGPTSVKIITSRSSIDECKVVDLLSVHSEKGKGDFYRHSIYKLERNKFYVNQSCGHFWDRYHLLEEKSENGGNFVIFWGCVEFSGQNRHEEALWVLGKGEIPWNFSVGTIDKKMLKKTNVLKASSEDFQCVLCDRCSRLDCKQIVRWNFEPLKWTMWSVVYFLAMISLKIHFW